MQQLRPYQVESIQGLRKSLAAGKRRPVLVAPTGSGKTTIAAEIIRSAVAKAKDVLFLAPRRELIYQASARLHSHGVEHGIIMAGEPRSLMPKVQVASFDTLYVRGFKNGSMAMPKADLVLVDEAHLTIAPTRRQMLEQAYGDAMWVGLTATPCYQNNKGLGDLYDDLVLSWTMRQMVDNGYLVAAKYFSAKEPDLHGVKLNKHGDYNEKMLSAAIDKPKLVGDIFYNWKRIASEKKTVVFCVDRKHARHVCEEFLQNGVKAEYLDGETPKEERKGILQRIASGETQVLVNVFVLVFGWDSPSVECAVLARPTKSLAAYLQMGGRVLRPHGGKEYATIIDHAGAVHEHGFLDDFIPWSLDSRTNIKEQRKKLREERQEPKEIHCGECGAAFKRSRTCPNCGHEIIPKGKPIPVHQADLQEVKKTEETAAAHRNRTHSWEDKQRFYGELLQYVHDKGKKDGYAAHKYKAKYGVWPNDSRVRNADPVPVSQETLTWIQGQNIRYAKSQKNRAA